MKLSIISTKKLQNFYLKDLNNKIFNLELDTEQNIPEGWYELTIPFINEKIEIQDILINNESIKELMHTGFYTDGNGIVYQPANAVWDKNGKYTIWIHTQLGILWQRLFDQIRGGDFGTNLFEKYMLTVDKNIVIKDHWNNTLKSYYANGYGPNWWLKNDKLTPYQPLKENENDILNTDTNQLLLELEKCLPFRYDQVSGVKGWNKLGLKEGCADLPFIEISNISSLFVQNFIKKIGYKRIIDITIQKLNSNTAVPIHRDDHYRRKGYPYTSGAKKFYWNITDPKNIYFKLGFAGLIPLEKPLFINTTEHVHAVVNQSEEERTVIHMYGEL
jgi:hypothetical protein